MWFDKFCAAKRIQGPCSLGVREDIVLQLAGTQERLKGGCVCLEASRLFRDKVPFQLVRRRIWHPVNDDTSRGELWKSECVIRHEGVTRFRLVRAMLGLLTAIPRHSDS